MLLPVADSCLYMAKPIQYCKVKKKKKNPPANAGDTGSIPDPGRSHMLCSTAKNKVGRKRKEIEVST